MNTNMLILFITALICAIELKYTSELTLKIILILSIVALVIEHAAWWLA